MYTGLLHTHRLVVILFLVLYLVKLILLLFNRHDLLAKVSKTTRIPEMVISALFLLTGIIMLTQTAKITPILIVKIVAVLASIPIAVIGFKRNNKILATLSVFLIVMAYGLAEMNKIGVSHEELSPQIVTDVSSPDYDATLHGAALYNRNCIVCHGVDGALNKSGAKDLSTSKLKDEEIRQLLINGKNSMPSYKKLYTPEEMDAIISYVKTLRK